MVQPSVREKKKKGSTYALNRPKPSKLALQVLFVRAVVQTRDDQGFEGIASNVRVIVWCICSKRNHD